MSTPTHADHALLEYLDDGIVLHDIDGRITWANGVARCFLNGRDAPVAADRWDQPGLNLVDEYGDPVVPANRPVRQMHLSSSDEPGRLLGTVRLEGAIEWALISGRVLVANGANAPAFVVTIKPIHVHRDHLVARRRSHDRVVERERQLRVGYDQSPVPMLTLTLQGAVLWANPAACELLGSSVEDLAASGVRSFVHLDETAEVMERLEDFIAGRLQAHTDRRRLVHRDGHTIHCRTAVTLVNTRDGEAHHLFVQLVDISLEVERNEQLTRAQARLTSIVNDAPVGTALVSANGSFTNVNRALCELTGHNDSTLLTMVSHDLFHPDDRRMAGEHFMTVVDGSVDSATMEFRIVDATGATRWVCLQVVRLDDHDHSSRGPLLVQVHDITDQREFEARLRHIADHDPLTGLVNRRRFEELVAHHCGEVQRYGARGSVLLLDLDNFKYVNDRLGHAAGDELIIAVADVLRSRLRATDTIARIGGDEFAILLPRATTQEASIVAQSLIDAVKTQAVRLSGDHKRPVTTSIGIASFTDQPTTPSDIMVAADVAMYDAKGDGRNCFALASDSNETSRTRHRMTWVERIEDALANDRFVVHGQTMRGNGMCGDEVELLIRMVDRDDPTNLIGPASFLYVAERVGLITQIDRWMTGQALELLKRHPTVSLAVNLSGRSLGDADVLRLLHDAARQRAPVGRLTFEVTETAAVANILRAQQFADEVRRLGCKLALDDFGAGFGSFYYLKHLPFDVVKIDGEFVANAVNSTTDRTIIASLVTLAHELGTLTVAEFVHDLPTLELMVDLGVDRLQGWAIDQPRPIDEVIAEWELRES
jgi:diguanylate cyclase (GGDEF)-like protein/PAS domain S-box-containing protein